MKKAASSVIILALLLSQPAVAASYPITISYGRSWPLSIAIDSARGLVFVDSTSGENPPVGYTFGVINATSHSLIRAIPLDEIPGPIALDQATGNVYVAGNDSIEVFNATNAIEMIHTSGHQILRMAHDASVSPYIFFTSGDNVFALDPGSSELVLNATVSGGPYWPVLDPASGTLYVSEYLSAKIAVLNASTLAPVSTIALPSCCAAAMAVNPRTQTLYAATGTNAVDIVDMATGRFEKSVQVAQSSENSTVAIALDEETGHVFVASSPGGSIVELDGSGRVIRTLQVQSEVAGLAVNPITRELFATNYHQLTVFEVAGRGDFRVLLVTGVVVVAAVAAVAYLLFSRKERLQRLRVQSGMPKEAAMAVRNQDWTL